MIFQGWNHAPPQGQYMSHSPRLWSIPSETVNEEEPMESGSPQRLIDSMECDSYESPPRYELGVTPQNKFLSVSSPGRKRCSLPANFVVRNRTAEYEEKLALTGNSMNHSAYVQDTNRKDMNDNNELMIMAREENGQVSDTISEKSVAKSASRLVGRCLTRRPENRKQVHSAVLNDPSYSTNKSKQIRKSETKIQNAEADEKLHFWQKAKQYVYKILQLCMLVNVIILAMIGLRVASSTSCADNGGFNITELKNSLKSQVFGQHIAIEVLPSIIQNHLEKEDRNTLVLSFHGWTGIGKNHISGIISDHIRTKTVQKLIVPLHFPHEKYEKIHSQQLVDWVLGNVSGCALNLVIVDEVDKAQWNILPALETMITKLHDLGLNNTKVIVFLLSNTGGSIINKYLLEHMSHGQHRETVTQNDLVELLLNPKQFSRSWHYVLHNEGLLDGIIPFLPLEKLHVKQCIKQTLSEHEHVFSGDRNDLISKVAEELTYFPQGMPVFSTTGCRKVPTKLDLAIQ